MEKNKEKQFDAFLKKAIKEVELDAPSLNFTEDLLEKLEISQVKKSSTAYKPLISKTIWVIIGALILIALGGAFIGDFESTLNWWPSMNLNTNYVFGGFLSIVISSTYLYGFVGLAFFLFVQIYFIKNHVNRQFTTN